MHPAAGPVQEQVIQLQVVQATLPPGIELVLDRLTHPRHRRLAQRCFGAQRIRQRRLDITNTQAADEPGDDQRLQRVRLGHPGAKQPGGEAFGGAAQLGPLHRDRPCGGLDRGRAVAVATARACVLDAHAALVTGPAEELGHLRLQRGLDDQPGTEASDLLQHVDQVTVTAEQGVDLGTDPLAGRYSTGHGRGSSFADCQVLKGTYVRRHLHRQRDTTLGW